MEKLLHKLARQLDSLDEASLMALWSKYATLTSRFEPTRRWEEACLVFSLIQAKRWKNQLFNYSWSQQRLPPLKNNGECSQEALAMDFDLEGIQDWPEAPQVKTQCKVLSFKPLASSGDNTPLGDESATRLKGPDSAPSGQNNPEDDNG